VIARVAPSQTPKFMKSALTYIAVSAPVAMPAEPMAMPEVRLKPEAAAMREEARPEPDTPVPPVVEIKPREIQSQPPAAVHLSAFPPPEPRSDKKPETVEKPPPQITVGAFATSETPSRTMNANRQVDPVGFDAPAAQGSQIKTKEMAVGSFESADSANPRPGTDRPVGTLTADAGFGRTAVAAAQPAGNRTVSDPGFGTASAGSPGQKVRTAAVLPTGFADAQATPTTGPKPVPPPERIDIPMEVLSKPTPIYTAEARDLKLEGDVSLEVEFSASGTAKVLRVVRGLGHGLDEAATQAAESIKFKPAQSHGKAVDFKTTVHITFRLT
jgi:TonB family protein